MVSFSDANQGGLSESSRREGFQHKTNSTAGRQSTEKRRSANRPILRRPQSSGKRLCHSGQPRFAIFGIGDYSFAAHKVAIAGFYKKFIFTKIGYFRDKPIVLDDTAYFLACRSEEEADCIASILNSDLAREFYSAFVFWDSKRPITVELLKRLNILAIAKERRSRRRLVAVSCGKRGRC